MLTNIQIFDCKKIPTLVALKKDNHKEPKNQPLESFCVVTFLPCLTAPWKTLQFLICFLDVIVYCENGNSQRGICLGRKFSVAHNWSVFKQSSLTHIIMWADLSS